MTTPLNGMLWGHIDEHDIHVVPHDVRPELLRRARDEGAAPDDGVVFMLQKRVHRHHLDAALGDEGIDLPFRAARPFMHAEHFGDGRARDVGIEHRRAHAEFVRVRSQKRRDERFAHAALAARDGDDALYFCVGMKGLDEGLLIARGAVAAARRAVVRTFCHRSLLPYRFSRSFYSLLRAKSNHLRILRA